jgi:arylsulfatase A
MRRAFIASWLKVTSIAAALAVMVGVTLAGVTMAAPADRRPNVVILYADDMGVGDVAAANPESKIPTPHLDRL